MARTPSEQPTDVELQILRVLWDLKSATARQIHDGLSEGKETNYSTTVKMLKIMLDKGWVERDDSVRPQVFTPTLSREKTGARFVRDLVQKVYNGSAMTLALHALSSNRATEDEIKQMRELLDRMEKRK